jgi:hypothetical protein
VIVSIPTLGGLPFFWAALHELYSFGKLHEPTIPLRGRRANVRL